MSKKKIKDEQAKRNENGNPKNLTDRYLERLKNYPFIAIIIVLGISVIALSQFTDSLEKLLSFLPKHVDKLPDLTICKIDTSHARIDICNLGNAEAPTDNLYLAWSEGGYKKTEWNNVVLVGALKYIDNQTIPPGKKLSVIIDRNLT